MKVLFIDACVREQSRTRALAEAVLNRLSGTVTTVRLSEQNLTPMTERELLEREAKNRNLDDPLFSYAKRFSEADCLVVAAPFWDLSFPSALKLYLEKICIGGITFRYGKNGAIESLCRADRLFYVTTAGGYIRDKNFGFNYVKALSETFFGISKVFFFSAEGLDIHGNKPDEILQNAKQRVQTYFDENA